MEKSVKETISTLQTENEALRIVNQTIEEDYNALKRMLQCKHPDVWQEFLNLDPREVTRLKDTKATLSRNQRMPRTQFELHTMDYDTGIIRKAYEWCLKNLPLKDECGIQYRVNQLYIVTSSQKILDKVNAHFGSNFSFNHPIGELRFFISAKSQ